MIHRRKEIFLIQTSWNDPGQYTGSDTTPEKHWIYQSKKRLPLAGTALLLLRWKRYGLLFYMAYGPGVLSYLISIINAQLLYRSLTFSVSIGRKLLFIKFNQFNWWPSTDIKRGNIKEANTAWQIKS